VVTHGRSVDVPPDPEGVEYYVRKTVVEILVRPPSLFEFQIKKDPAMSTFTQILYQIVFSTKLRERTLTSNGRPQLFRYIWGVIKGMKSHPYWINGVEDHLHIATYIHPTVSLSDFVKEIKLATTFHIKENGFLKYFGGWQDGYAAFTYSIKEKQTLIEYIKNQEEHHRKVTFKEELIDLLHEHGIEFDEKYLL